MSESELIQIFADNLESLMEEAKMSKSELAKWTGLNKSTISRYLAGERLPTVKALVNICNVLDCEVEDLTPTYEIVE